MAGDSPKFMLFPHMVLSDREYRHLSLLLPGFSVLQVLHQVAGPEWLSPMVGSWPVITDEQRLEAIRLALKGFHEFAVVHGDESALTSLSLDRIARDFSESRFQIQAEVKGTDAKGADERETRLLEAAVFLEMARELDERELDVAAGLVEMDNLEGEFREILGISPGEALEDALETISPPLRPDKNSSSYLLTRRIRAWLRLLSVRMPPARPVLVTTEAVVEELLDWVREQQGTTGTRLEPDRIPLASIPAMDELAVRDFLSLLHDPETSTLLTSYWQQLEQVILTPGDPTVREVLSANVARLQDCLRHHGREAGLSGERTASLELVADEELSWQTVLEDSRPVAETTARIGTAPATEPLQVLVWRS